MISNNVFLQTQFYHHAKEVMLEKPAWVRKLSEEDELVVDHLHISVQNNFHRQCHNCCHHNQHDNNGTDHGCNARSALLLLSMLSQT